MDAIGSAAKALATSAAGSPMKRGNSSLQRVLDARMMLSEAIEAATRIVERYPNGGANAGKGYIGALAETLAGYPRQVAVACVGVKGISAECKFLPTVADVIAWCERAVEPLRRDRDRELRVERQLVERQEFEAPRRARLTYGELKSKYGDGHGGWGVDATAELRRGLSRDELIGMCGQDAWDAMPNGAPRREAAE
jgi:hypothetical protein